ncbi:hypothetical protein F5B22DRAFT_602730 [Xylaria bambusicola]|uniref:uncharacterized protein n=1 Tax=Xylaria bambusicola TaxID=326684 RepID=UPI0020079154|nr:uncharacterized protein F5B22DRAFT_602730 [Xylaria bambusicola]KAI0517859.1 hypothetical protein F5B22DRAFT_602730 [Xylaria bambusicola]
MTESDDIIAAVPSGLLHFKRVNDHVSKPWSEGRLLPNTATLNDSSVSGVAAQSDNSRLWVYCVSGGKLHSFYRSTKDGSSWVKDSHSPFPKYRISGTPAVTSSGGWDSQRWNLVVPCQSGGLLHTSTKGSSEKMLWEPIDHIAKDLGFISSVSVATIQRNSGSLYGYSFEKTDIVMVCVARGRLHTAEGKLAQSPSGYSSPLKWEAQAPTRILHPGEVTGNPMLIKKDSANQLDLLVPSAEGGIFHFIRTASTPDEWHMIACITFHQGLPAASCLAIHSNTSYGKRKFRAVIQSGGRLYYVMTTESAKPWSGSYLRPIVSPGPLSG